MEYISEEKAEMCAVSGLIEFARVYEQRFALGEISETEACDYRAKLVEGLLWIIYKERRNDIPISTPDSEMTNRELVNFIHDEALAHYAQENPLYLSESWDGKYEIAEDDIF